MLVIVIKVNEWLLMYFECLVGRRGRREPVLEEGSAVADLLELLIYFGPSY